MTRAELQKHLKERVPSVQFEKTDALGTRMSKHFLHCRVPKDDVKRLEEAAEEVGKKAVWPTCSEVYACYRVIAL